MSGFLNDETRDEYWACVKAIAEDVLEYDEREDRERAIEEEAQHSQWVLYTGRQLVALLATANKPDTKEVEELSGVEPGFARMLTTAAYLAFSADIEEEVEWLLASPFKRAVEGLEQGEEEA